MKKNLHRFVIILAIIARLVFSASTYHSDLGAFALSGKFIAGEGKVFSFYDEIASKDQVGNMVVHRQDVVFNYQPLAYLIPSFVYSPFSSIVNQTGDRFMNRSWITSNTPTFVPLLTLFKLPMILADLAILWFLPKLFIKEKSKKLAQLLWALNPLAIFVSSVMGQVDIIIALLVLVSFYFAQKNKALPAVAFVALSALIKPIGLILIPLYAIDAFHKTKNIFKSFLVGFTGLAVYILGIIPFLGSASYRHYALMAEQINKSLFASISIASGHDIPLFFIVYLVVVLAFWSKKISLKTALLGALLSSLAFTHFHPQWLVWLMPLVLISAVKTNEYLSLLLMLLCWFGVLFSFDASLHLQMFLHSSLSFPSSLTGSALFGEAVQLSRAGLVALLLWFITFRKSK